MVEFTPDQFLALSSDMPIDAEVRENADDLAQMMLDGQRIDPPYLVVRDDGVVDIHDGRHRALAAKQLGIGKIPVLLMGEGGTAFPSTIQSIRPQLGARDPSFVGTLEQTAKEFDISAEQLALELEAAGGDITQTPRFKEWFRESKAVDSDGRPLVVYHGTSADIEAFDPDRRVGYQQGVGIWMSGSPAVATTYAAGVGRNVLPTYASLQQPIVVEAAGSVWSQLGADTVIRIPETVASAEDVALLRDLGIEAQEGQITEAREVRLGDLGLAGREGKFSTNDIARWARTLGGVDGVIFKDIVDRGPGVLDAEAQAEARAPATNILAFEPGQVKSVFNRGTFDPTSPLILEQEGLTAEEKRQTKQDERVADKNSHGLMPYLRDYSDAEPRRNKKQALVQDTKNNNAREQLSRVDEILALNPDAHTSVEAWLQMMADAYGVQDVPIAPYRFIEEINGQGSIDNLARLTPGQIADADHGFENAAAFREAYTSGKLSVETTAKLFLWSFLSRGVSPYTQEGLFIDAFPGIDPWIAQAAAGNLDVEAFAEWAKTVAPKGSGQPGAGATHNLNAFGRDFLVKMSQDVGDGTGRSRLQYIHDLMADPNSTGQQVRREFAAVGEGVGIDNKVVSFTLLVAGFDDVLVLDRVQFRQMYNDGRFDGVNLYDGFKTEDGKAVTGSGLAKQGDGARGILIYEAMERAVSARIDEIYTALGREGQGSVGRYHWETWVADSQQEASHGSLGAILPAALGDKTAIHKVAAKQGEYGSYAYGARYGVDGSGISYFTYPTPTGKVWLFTVEQFVEFQQEVKKAANKVVPTKFKVTEAGNAPWYQRPEVNRDALDQLAERISSGPAGDGAGTLFQDGSDQLISDRLPAGAALAQQQKGVTARGSFQQERDTYGNLENIITLLENADLSTFLHEGGHFWLFQMKQDLDSDYLTEEGRARLQKQFDTTVNWFLKNSRQAWADIQRMAKAARKTANSNPDDADAQRRAERMEAAVSRAKLGGGAVYMEDVARNFMNGTIENGTDLEVAYHELWARGVEKYLGEGKAPSAALRNAFASYSAWMTGIYKNLRRLNVQLDDDIRGVFDRLVATEEAIAEEVQRDAYKIPDEVRNMANEQELAELQRLAKEAEFEAQQRLQSVVAEEIASMNRAEYKAAKAAAEERISAEVYAEPKYAAVELSRRGRLPDGTQLTTSDGKPAKLRMLRDEFVAVFGVDAARAMPRGMFTNKAEDATGIAEFAMLAGFDSQDSMVAELTKPMPQARDLIRQRTNEYMDAQFSELLDPAMVAEKASEIVLSDKQIELAELQARILKRMARPVLLTAAQRRAIEEGAPPAAVDRERVETAKALATGAEPVPEQLDLAAAEAQRAGNIPQRRAQNAARRQTISLLRGLDITAIKQAAAEYVNRAAVKDLTPQRYIAAAERLSRKASKAIASRDYEEAFALLEQKALNLAIAKQARDAQKKVDSIVSRQNRLAKRSDKKLAGSYRLQIFNVARALMDAAGIVSYPVDSLVAVVDAASAEYAKDAPEYASLVGRAQNVATTLEPYKGQYRNMPYSEFLSAVQEIQSIVTEARAAQSMLIDGERVEHEIIVNEMSAQTADRAPEGEPLGRGTPEQREYISALGTLKAALTRVESWARALDGGRADGPFNTYIVKPVFTALTEYYANRTAPIQKLVEALRPIAGSLKASGKIAAPELDNYVFQNKAELLHAILHTGNESNKQKLLRGGQVDVNTRLKYQWTPTTEASDTLDTSQWDAFMRRMYAEGVITKADMDAVKAIWDIFEETKGAAQKAHFRMHGFYFTEIEPSPVQTPFGTYPGGYVPAITDKMMDVAGGARIDAENLASQQNASMFPGAENGFTKSRVEAFAEPLELDLLKIPGHFDRVMKYAYLGPAIRDVARLVTSRDFRSMINRFSPNAVDQLIVPWLQRTVSQTVTTRGPGQRFTSVLSTISNRIGMQTMAGNIVNAAQQITGLSSAAVIVPPRLLMKHLASFKQNGVGVRTFISQHSAYMDVRFRNGVNDMLQNVDNILRDTTVLAKTQAYAQRYAYFAQQAVQNLVDPVVWMAAFDHAHDIGVWQSAYDANQRLGETEATKKADAAAAYYADSIVRQTQAPMGAAEVSRIETGTPLWRIFVKFYSYFNAMLNLNAAEFDITKRQIGYKGKAGKFFYLYMMGVLVPAVVAEGISMAARGEFDTEDDDDLAVALAELFLLSQIKYVAGFVPGGSAAVNRIIGQFTDVPYDDRLSFSPVLGIFDQAISGTANLVEDIVTAAVEGEPARDASKIIRDGLNAIALIFGLPTNWFSKPVQFLQKIEEGKEDPEGVADYVKGFTTGRSQPPKQ